MPDNIIFYYSGCYSPLEKENFRLYTLLLDFRFEKCLRWCIQSRSTVLYRISQQFNIQLCNTNNTLSIGT